VAAPHWLVQLALMRPAPVEWRLVARAALAIATPIAVGLALGRLDVGVQASIGALCGTFVARSGPYRFRLRRIGFSSLAGALGFLAGGLAGGHGWLAALVIVALAGISALVSSVGANASAAGLMLLVFGVLGAGQAGMWHPVTATGWFAVGAGWTLLLAVAAWPVRATVPERAALATVYTRIAELLELVGTRAAGPARQRLTAALNDAYDALLSARSRLEGRDADYRKLFVLLSETTPVVEAAVALHNARRPPPRPLLDAVTAVGAAIRDDAPPPELADVGDSPLAEALRGLAKQFAGDTPTETTRSSRGGVREWFAVRFDALRPGPATWRFAARLMLCVGLAEVLSRQLELERSYWVTLTVALVLKPDFGSVFARAVQRAVGTVLGVLLGAAVLALDPRGWLLVGLMAVFAALLPIGQARNYGLFSIFVTPLVIVQLDLAQAGSWSLVTARLIDTATGCAIVLVFGYLLWPGARTPRLGTQLADVTAALAQYAARALGEDPAGRSALRRGTYRKMSDLRVEAQRLISEPLQAGRSAAAWWPAIIGLDRVTDAVTRVAVDLDQGAPSPPPSDVDCVVAALDEVAAAVREERAPRNPQLPSTPLLAAVTTDLTALYDALRG
jgi:uncharacterized membrane protein YccC